MQIMKKKINAICQIVDNVSDYRHNYKTNSTKIIENLRKKIFSTMACKLLKVFMEL
jgi:hypothetical protein